MNWLDIILLFTVLGAIGAGLGKGFARSAVAFVTFLVAVGAALWFYAPVGFWLHSYIDSKPVANLVACVGVFLLVTLSGAALESRAKKFVKHSDLSVVDHALGGVFGAAHGVFCAAMLVLVMMALLPEPNGVRNSKYAPYLTSAVHVVSQTAPDEIREGYQRARRDLDRVAPKAVSEGLDRLTSY